MRVYSIDELVGDEKKALLWQKLGIEGSHQVKRYWLVAGIENRFSYSIPSESTNDGHAGAIYPCNLHMDRLREFFRDVSELMLTPDWPFAFDLDKSLVVPILVTKNLEDRALHSILVTEAINRLRRGNTFYFEPNYDPQCERNTRYRLTDQPDSDPIMFEVYQRFRDAGVTEFQVGGFIAGFNSCAPEVLSEMFSRMQIIRLPVEGDSEILNDSNDLAIGIIGPFANQE